MVNGIAYDFMPLEIISVTARFTLFVLGTISLINVIRFTHYGIKLLKLKLNKEQ